MIELLNAKNDVTILPVTDPAFAPYGRIVEGIDFSAAIAYMEQNTPVPESGNIYVPGDETLEALPVCEEVRRSVFGGMPIQIGYCNGRNSTYNGFEYHKGSEVNVAVTDFMLVLGHVWQIRDNRFYVGEEQVFFIPAGTAVEMYATTLHLSPCKVTPDGFKDIVILPRGTNTPLASPPEDRTGENRLLLQTNKWVLSHPDREPLMKQGAFPGLVGENKELKYITND
ncbi:MAG: DUF4867 family protein [Clostridia bacterium]|nr:DUF4867 family protein [Clostridia bacterium]